MKTDATKPTRGNGPVGRKLGAATLAGIPGAGIIQVVRGQRGNILQILGTWRPEDESSRQGVGQLKRACATGEPVRYRGALHDPQHSDDTQIELDVRVDWFQSYDRLVEPGATGEGGTAPKASVTLYRLAIDALPSAAATAACTPKPGRSAIPVAGPSTGGTREPAPLR